VTAVSVRTSAWYGDSKLELSFPDDWEVSVRWPETPPRLTDEQIEAAVCDPVGQPRISELAQGARKPVVILDDLTRPTPTDRVVPFVLRELETAGVPAAHVTFVVATGTHGLPDSRALAKKAGPEAARSCRLVPHDDRARDLVNLGRSSFGTPVLVNNLVAASDYVLGIGGIYPQHSTGFGGGAKLAIGVLGRRSITHLHYGHPSMNGGLHTHNDFRRDLSEIAQMIGLRTSISVHVDANRDIVRLVCGSHDDYYDQAVAFSRRAYSTGDPGAADVVISNAYPMDVSLTFMRSKGILPLLHAAPGASRIVMSACPEGPGHHGLFPFVNPPRLERQRQIARRILVKPRSLPAMAATAVARRARTGNRPPPELSRRPIHLYAPGARPGTLPPAIPGMTPVYSWSEVLERAAAEQADRTPLQAVVYPCAPIQIVVP
jgi:lactate racemase